MDKKELLDVASDLFRVVELQIIETEKLRNKAQKLQEKLSRLTQRALDAGDSAAFSSIFLASSFFCSQTLSTPAPAPVTQTVGRNPTQSNQKEIKS